MMAQIGMKKLAPIGKLQVSTSSPTAGTGASRLHRDLTEREEDPWEPRQRHPQRPDGRPARPQRRRLALRRSAQRRAVQPSGVINIAEDGSKFTSTLPLHGSSTASRTEKPKTDRPDGFYSHRARREGSGGRAGAGNRRMEAQPSSAGQFFSAVRSNS